MGQRSKSESRNAGSIVVRLVYQDRSVLFGGDSVGRHSGNDDSECIAVEKVFRTDLGDDESDDGDEEWAMKVGPGGVSYRCALCDSAGRRRASSSSSVKASLRARTAALTSSPIAPVDHTRACSSSARSPVWGTRGFQPAVHAAIPGFSSLFGGTEAVLDCRDVRAREAKAVG